MLQPSNFNPTHFVGRGASVIKIAEKRALDFVFEKFSLGSLLCRYLLTENIVYRKFRFEMKIFLRFKV